MKKIKSGGKQDEKIYDGSICTYGRAFNFAPYGKRKHPYKQRKRP
jgi:hypothetical protein